MSETASSLPKTAAKKVPARPARKVAPKPAAKKLPAVAKKTPTRKAPVTVKPAAKANEKVKKPKMVRDSFSIPKSEYAVLEALKLRSANLSRSVKKTELLRAGIKVLAALSDTTFLAALKSVPSLKTGRPAKVKTAKLVKAVKPA